MKCKYAISIDCSEPFVVRHGTDASGDGGGGSFAAGAEASQEAVQNRGTLKRYTLPEIIELQLL